MNYRKNRFSSNMGPGFFFKYVFPVLFVLAFVVAITQIVLTYWIGYQFISNPEQFGQGIGNFIGAIVDGASK